MNDFSIEAENLIKLEPEMMLLPHEFRTLKEEGSIADGEDSILACSSDGALTVTGSNVDFCNYNPLRLTVTSEDSGHEGRPDNPRNFGNGKQLKQVIKIERVCSGDLGNPYILDEGSKKVGGSQENPDELDEVCIIEERVCKGHWRDRNGRVAKACCTCCFRCSICGTSILRRLDFLRHVKSHMAERKADCWKLQLKRVPAGRRVRQPRATKTATKGSVGRMFPWPVARIQPQPRKLKMERVSVDRSVRKARATETEARGSAGRIWPRPVARLQPRPQLALKGRMRGCRPSVHLVDEGHSERVDPHGDIASHTQFPLQGVEDSFRKPRAGKTAQYIPKMKVLRVVIRRLELLNEPNASVPKPRSNESAETKKKTMGEKLPQSQNPTEAGGGLSCNSSNVSTAPTILEADKEISKTQPLSPVQASESTLNNIDAVNEGSTVMEPQSRSSARGRILRKPHATKCATCNAHPKKKQHQSHKKVAIPRLPVQRTSDLRGRVPKRNSLAAGKEASSVKTSNLESKTPSQTLVHAEAPISENELAAEGRSTNEEVSEKVLLNTPDQSHVPNGSGKQTIITEDEDKGADSFTTGIPEMIYPRLVVRLEPEVLLTPEKQTGRKGSKIKKKVVSMTGSTCCSNPETNENRPQPPLKSPSEVLSKNLVTSEETSTGQLLSPTQVLRAFRKPRKADSVSIQLTEEQAVQKIPFSSQRQNNRLEQGAVRDCTSLCEVVVDQGASDSNGKSMSQTQGHSQAIGGGRKALERNAGSNCAINNAVADEQLLNKAHGESNSLKCALPDQTLSEGSDVRKEKDSGKKVPHLHAETSGILATRKRHAGIGEVTASVQSLLESHKGSDAKQRTNPVQPKKALKVTFKVPVSEEVPPKTQRQSHSGRGKSQSYDCSAPNNAVSEASLEQADAGELVFVAQESPAPEVSLKKPEAADIAKKTMKTRLQAHMQADEENRTFRCSYCKATFPDVESLRPHVESHRSWEETFHCEVCHRRFSARAHLALHMNAHKQEKPFACDRCERRFALRSHLALHRRSHEKPFGCGACGERFARISSLRAHVRSHTLSGNGGKRKLTR